MLLAEIILSGNWCKIISKIFPSSIISKEFSLAVNESDGDSLVLSGKLKEYVLFGK